MSRTAMPDKACRYGGSGRSAGFPLSQRESSGGLVSRLSLAGLFAARARSAALQLAGLVETDVAARQDVTPDVYRKPQREVHRLESLLSARGGSQ